VTRLGVRILTFVLNDHTRKTAAGLLMDNGGAGFLLTIKQSAVDDQIEDQRREQPVERAGRRSASQRLARRQCTEL
jgi:hypothetical protein